MFSCQTHLFSLKLHKEVKIWVWTILLRRSVRGFFVMPTSVMFFSPFISSQIRRAANHMLWNLTCWQCILKPIYYSKMYTMWTRLSCSNPRSLVEIGALPKTDLSWSKTGIRQKALWIIAKISYQHQLCRRTRTLLVIHLQASLLLYGSISLFLNFTM